MAKSAGGSGKAAAAPSGGCGSRLARWWFEDLPAVDGRLRFVYYGGLLLLHILCLRASGAFQEKKCVFTFSWEIYDDLGFDLPVQCGLFKPLVPYASPMSCLNAVRLLRYSLALSALGVLGFLPRVVAALSFTWLHGIYMCAFDKSRGHEHFLTTVSLLAMCFANYAPDIYSVDAILLRGWRRLVGSSTDSSSSPTHPWGCAARKLVLCTAVNAYFCAGMHKLQVVGPSWMDGKTLLYGVSNSQNPLSKTAQALLLQHGWILAPVLAVVSIVFELGAVAAIAPMAKRTRLYVRALVVFLFAAFHFGIKLVMMPNFVMNCFSYILCMDWSVAFGNSSSSSSSSSAAASPLPPPSKLRRVTAFLYTALAAVMVAASVCKVEAWPSSSWMLYTWHPEVPGWNSPYTPAEAIEATTACVTYPLVNPACSNIAGNVHTDPFIRLSRRWGKVVVVLENGVIYVDWNMHPQPPSDEEANVLPFGLVELAAVQQDSWERKKKGAKKMKGISTASMSGLKSRMTDAVAHTIAVDGLPCLAGGKLDEFKSPLANGTASKLAVQLHENLDESKYTKNEKIKAVSILYKFADPATKQSVWCVVGTSRTLPAVDPLGPEGDGQAQAQQGQAQAQPAHQDL